MSLTSTEVSVMPCSPFEYKEIGKNDRPTTSISKGASIMTKFYIQYVRYALSTLASVVFLGNN
jgi:hypothetical protein